MNRDGWRSSRWAAETVEIERSLIELVSQADRLVNVRIHDQAQIAQLADDLHRRGFDEPMVVVIDQRGRVMLKDGHHRLLAAVALDLPRVPVRFRRGERVSVNGGAAAQELIPMLLGVRP